MYLMKSGENFQFCHTLSRYASALLSGPIDGGKKSIIKFSCFLFFCCRTGSSGEKARTGPEMGGAGWDRLIASAFSGARSGHQKDAVFPCNTCFAQNWIETMEGEP